MSDVLPEYEHTEIGWIPLVVIGFVGLVVTAVKPPTPTLVVMVPVLPLVLLLAGWMRVVVSRDDVRCRLGLFARRRITIARIVSAEAVGLPWYYGWGIRLTPKGWLWRVSGLRGVRLTYEDGGHFTIGTSDDEALARAINRCIAIARPG